MELRTLTQRLRIVPPAIVASLVACGSSGDATHADADGGAVTLTDRAMVLGADEAAGVMVQADRLVFPAATHAAILSRKAGDVLVGDRGEAGSGNANGFLRRV